MNNLPTREWLAEENVHSIQEWADATMDIMEAYADSVLITEAEWRDSLEVNVGMIRAARDAQAEADRQVLEDDENDYTWWHVVLTAAIAALGEQP